MATEPGVVTRIGKKGPQTVWVKVTPNSACESCASRDQCSTKSGSEAREVEVLNDIGASEGDRIQLAISSSSLLKATFLLYIFPVLCMLAGGITGQAIAAHFRWDSSLPAVIAAFASLAAAMVVVRFGGNRMARNAAYRPRIVRVLGRNPDSANVPGCQEPFIPTA